MFSCLFTIEQTTTLLLVLLQLPLFRWKMFWRNRKWPIFIILLLILSTWNLNDELCTTFRKEIRTYVLDVPLFTINECKTTSMISIQWEQLIWISLIYKAIWFFAQANHSIMPKPPQKIQICFKVGYKWPEINQLATSTPQVILCLFGRR